MWATQSGKSGTLFLSSVESANAGVLILSKKSARLSELRGWAEAAPNTGDTELNTERFLEQSI